MLLDISYSYKNIFIAKLFGSVDARMQNWSLQQQQEHRHDESERKSWILMKLSILGALHGCYVEYEVQCMWSGAAQVDYLVFLLSCLLAYKKAYSFLFCFGVFLETTLNCILTLVWFQQIVNVVIHYIWHLFWNLNLILNPLPLPFTSAPSWEKYCFLSLAL